MMHMLLLKKQRNHRQALSFHGIYFFTILLHAFDTSKKSKIYAN